MRRSKERGEEEGMHFSKRVLSHVRMKFALDEEAYKALSKDLSRGS
jgi:hypothetical protein